MSRFQFEADDHRYFVGYEPALASFFADVEPLEVDDEIELIELVDPAKIGAVPTLADLDALLAEQGVRIPQDFRELLAEEVPADPSTAAMDAVDARREVFAELGEVARGDAGEVRVTPGRMSVTYEHLSGELQLGWDPTFATFYAVRFSAFDWEQSEDLVGQSRLGEVPSPAALQAALEARGISVPDEVFDGLRQFEPVDSAAAVAEAMRRLDFRSTDIAAEAARQVAMTGFATPPSATPAAPAPTPPRWSAPEAGPSLER